MENPIIVPFDLNTARKIKSGEIEGSVLIGNIKIEFVYESKDCADRYNLLFVKKNESGISAIYADTEGRTFFNNVLELEVEAGAYFKKGDVLISTLGNPFIYNGIINREGDMGCIYGISAYGEITSEEVPIWTSVCGEDKSKYVRLATEEEKKSFAERIANTENLKKAGIIKQYLSEYKYLLTKEKKCDFKPFKIMEQRTATIPFDLETAKKINIGEIAGRIVTEKGQNRAEIVYEDNSSNCPLLVVIHSISVSADWFSATGKALSSANRLLLEVPEYTTFKDGDVLSNKDGSYIFILNTHGKYLTSFYASLNQKGILKIEDGLSAWENQIEKYRFATESERQKLVDALKASKEPKAKIYLKRFFGIEEKPKYEFKPFDKVLVRDEDDKEWHISLFAREIVDDYNGLPYKYECSNGTLWDYCIHFEGNECLLGTTENPEK